MTNIKKNRDQDYILDLCDSIIKYNGLREHKFDLLIGDPGRNGLARRLPVDAFYPNLQLVIEYQEKQHVKAVRHFDKPHRMTVSGVHRGEQRKLYDQRRRDVLPKMGISLLELCYTDFRHDAACRLKRDEEQDKAVIRRKLSVFVT